MTALRGDGSQHHSLPQIGRPKAARRCPRGPPNRLGMQAFQGDITQRAAILHPRQFLELVFIPVLETFLSHCH